MTGLPDSPIPGGEDASLALAQLNHYLMALSDEIRQLTSVELAVYRGKMPIAGWRLVLMTDEAGRRAVDFLVDVSFPYSRPTMVLVDRPAFNSWPHVEHDGTLCIWSDATSLADRAMGDIVDLTLARACGLIDAGASGANAEDFRTEFLSYWNIALSTGNPTIRSLLTPSPPSRPVFASNTSGLLVVADTKAELQRWLKNAAGPGGQPHCTRQLTDGKESGTQGTSAVYAWLGRPLLPREYPGNVSEMTTLLGRSAPDALAMVEKAAAGSPEKLLVVLGAETESGACLAGLLLRKGRPLRLPSGRASDPAARGFRPGKVPIAFSRARWLGSAQLHRTKVERVDHSWVHGRGRNPAAIMLQLATVVVLGCGSVGSPVAMKLIEAGVGNLVLVDPGIHQGANAGRHELGVDDILQPKAEALASLIRHKYPHVVSVHAVHDSWQAVRSGNPDLLRNCNLIVSAIGTWADEGALNEWHRAADLSPSIVYAWAEPHACAGHAVLISNQGGCLSCGFERDGTPPFAVTEWPDGGTVFTEAACGGSFSPYGPIELAYITTMAAELALDALTGQAVGSTHRVWAARRQRLEAAGGRWAPAWLSGDVERAQGGMLVEQAWNLGPCPVCRPSRRS